jgi:amidase
VLEEAIARAARAHPRVNAIVTPLYDEARHEIAGATAPLDREDPRPFAGVPFLVKDLDAAIAGQPLAAGSRFLVGYRPARDATIVTRFRRAGAVIFGKTNTPELGITPFTEPELHGPARNPWNPACTPGGSSGGAGAAVAAGIVPLAHGSDGGGSLRIPASCCGLFGLKPTRGRTPVGPDASELWSGLVVPHVLTRSVRDSAAMLDAIAGPEPTSPYWAPPQTRPYLAEVGAPPGRLRVALTKRPHLGTTPVHPDCAAAADDAAKLLADLGHHVEEADLGIDGAAFVRDFFAVVCLEVAAIIARAEQALGRRAGRRDLETSTKITAAIGRQKSALAIAMVRDRLEALARRVAGFYERFDLVLSPTLGTPPPLVGALLPKGIEAFGQEVLVALHLEALLRLPGLVDASTRRVFAFIPFNALENVTGQPAMSVPLAWNAAGLPIGVQLAARFGEEATLIRVAGQLEAARPWSQRRPSSSSASFAGPSFGRPSFIATASPAAAPLVRAPPPPSSST